MKKLVILILVAIATICLAGCEFAPSDEIKEVSLVKVQEPVKVENAKGVVVHKSEYGYHVHVENMSYHFTTAQYVINADGDYEFEIIGTAYTAKFIVHDRDIVIVERQADKTYCPFCGRVVE